MIPQHPAAPARQQRWIELESVYSAEIPPFAALEITDSYRPEQTGGKTPNGGRTVLKVTRPTKHGVKACVINGPCTIPVGGIGYPGTIHDPMLAKVGSSYSTGNEVGLTANSFELTDAATGFVVLGDYDTGVMRVMRSTDDDEYIYAAYSDYGIPAMSGITPGSAVCQLWRLGTSGDLESIADSRTVYNLNLCPIFPGWFLIAKDPDDTWWAIRNCEEESSSSSESSSQSSSESSSESSSQSSSESSSLTSSPSESESTISDESEKSSAIVRAAWSEHGYAALFVAEMPEVKFDDLLQVSITERSTTIAIDPKFLDVCEPGSLVVSGCVPAEPVAVGASIVNDQLIVKLNRKRQQPLPLTIRITGTRRGFAGVRFPDRTEEDRNANERFLRSAKPKAKR